MAKGRDALNTPARFMKAITPSDVADLPDGECQGIYVGGAGNVSLVAPVGGADVLLTAVPVGTQLSVSTTRVKSTGTTATSMVALYTK